MNTSTWKKYKFTWIGNRGRSSEAQYKSASSSSIPVRISWLLNSTTTSGWLCTLLVSGPHLPPSMKFSKTESWALAQDMKQRTSKACYWHKSIPSTPALSWLLADAFLPLTCFLLFLFFTVKYTQLNSAVQPPECIAVAFFAAHNTKLSL